MHIINLDTNPSAHLGVEPGHASNLLITAWLLHHRYTMLHSMNATYAEILE